MPNKFSWVFLSCSIVCFISYIILGNLFHIISVGTLICMFVMVVPIQLLHIYFSKAIKNDSFSGITGYDEKIDYNFYEIKKLLVRIDLHIGMVSTVYVFLLCVINCMNFKLEWINGVLLGLYVLDFIGVILVDNFTARDKIFINPVDKERSKRSYPITITYILLLFLGSSILIALFQMRGIENNTVQAMKLCGTFLFGIVFATIGYFLECNKIQKWSPNKEKYAINKSSIGCWFVSLLLFGFMCIILK